MTLEQLKKDLEELINLYFEEGDSMRFKIKIEKLAQELGIC